VGSLDDGAVGEGVRKWDPQFNDISAGFFEGVNELFCVRQTRITGGNISYKGFPVIKYRG
jgi:hypothetical protein